jgi:hypothetical protein
VAIARVMLKDAAILVLKEAAASLDSETAHHIHEALLHAFEGIPKLQEKGDHPRSQITKMEPASPGEFVPKLGFPGQS